jgi:DNA-binding transcriptional LysR family regulator
MVPPEGAVDFQLRFLTCFLTIVEEQSFSRAAAKLGMSQPSLSQRLQTLEHQLGFPLLNRSARSLELTVEGQLLLELFREMVGRGERVARLATDLREAEDRPIRLGATMYSDDPERATLLEDFLDAYPTAKIEIETMYTMGLYDALLSARCDLGFSVGPPPGNAFEFLELKRFRPELLIPKDSPLARQDEIGEEALEGLAIISVRRERFPALFDVAIHPLEEAGAVLTYPADQTPSGLVSHGRVHGVPVVMAFPFLRDAEFSASGYVRRPIRGLLPPVALMLLRPRDGSSHVGEELWQFARKR